MDGEIDSPIKMRIAVLLGDRFRKNTNAGFPDELLYSCDGWEEAQCKFSTPMVFS
jgi:hypothetical protein